MDNTKTPRVLYITTTGKEGPWEEMVEAMFETQKIQYITCDVSYQDVGILKADKAYYMQTAVGNIDSIVIEVRDKESADAILETLRSAQAEDRKHPDVFIFDTTAGVMIRTGGDRYISSLVRDSAPIRGSAEEIIYARADQSFLQLLVEQIRESASRERMN